MPVHPTRLGFFLPHLRVGVEQLKLEATLSEIEDKDRLAPAPEPSRKQ